MAIIVLDVFKSSAVITRGRGDIFIATTSIISEKLCEIDVHYPAKSCMLTVVSTVVVAYNGLALANNLVYRGGGG